MMTERHADDLIACQRLAVAGTMSAMLAHEFNNLMTPILARAMDALDRDDPDAMRVALDRTVGQVQKAITLSRHLLRLTDPENGDEPTICDVAKAVDEAVEEAVRPFKKDGIELQVSVPEGLQVNARSTLLEQVLLNLLVNARQAMKGVRGMLKVSAENVNGHVLIHVRDAGCGITQEDIDSRFMPFLQADPDTDAVNWQRVGLGLHVCRTICKEFAAKITVKANEGQGCTFTLHWPTA